MKAAHRLADQRHDVVNVMLDASLFRDAPTFCIDRSDLPFVFSREPWRGSPPFRRISCCAFCIRENSRPFRVLFPPFLYFGASAGPARCIKTAGRNAGKVFFRPILHFLANDAPPVSDNRQLRIFRLADGHVALGLSGPRSALRLAVTIFAIRPQATRQPIGLVERRCGQSAPAFRAAFSGGHGRFLPHPQRFTQPARREPVQAVQP